MRPGDLQRIRQIKVYCDDIAGFIGRFGAEYSAFIHDRAFFNAVYMCILQIGELANGLSEEFREETKEEMPWSQIRGMRNWIAHAYADVDEADIWNTAITDIPELLRFCETIIRLHDGTVLE